MNSRAALVPGSHGDARRLMRRRRLLVIDDEIMIGRFIRNALTAYDVETFDDPLRALERVRGSAFDYVCCDLMMPHMTGLEFHAQLKLIRPELTSQFALMTGAFVDAEMLAFVESQGAVLLRKPFGFLELTRCLEQPTLTVL
jgi:CheY-like chemotaxis protein